MLHSAKGLATSLFVFQEDHDTRLGGPLRESESSVVENGWVSACYTTNLTLLKCFVTSPQTSTDRVGILLSPHIK